MTTVQDKAKSGLWFLETKSVIRMQRRDRTPDSNDPRSDMLADVGYSSFKRLVVFSTEREREDRALRRNLLIETFTRSPQKSTRRASLQLGLPETTVWRVVHNLLHLHAYWPRKSRQ
jgi:hypothetical protein